MSGLAEWTSRFDLHRMYLRDGVRNAAYAAAIAHHVRPGSRVLDLGTGTGIWACVAAKAGAAKVVAVEFSDLADLARETVARNGLADVVDVVRADIRDIALARDFDVVIHELIGGLIWEEDMVELTAIAADRCLRPGGVLVPGEVRVWMCPWQLPGDRPRRADWPRACGLDFGHLADDELARWRRRATCVHGAPGTMLAPPQLVHTTRLGIDRAPPRELGFEAVAERDAVATGVLAFVEIDLGVSAIRTGPLDAPTNWGQLYIPAAEPMRLDAGARYAIRVTPSPAPDGWDLDWHAVYPVRHFAC
jgi:SAM-dependent methyltransferase